MAARKRAPQPETSAPDEVSAAGPVPDEPQQGESAPTPAAPAEAPQEPPVPSAPPHPVKRYRVAPSAHLGTRVGGFVLTERGWVRDDTSTEQE